MLGVTCSFGGVVGTHIHHAPWTGIKQMEEEGDLLQGLGAPDHLRYAYYRLAGKPLSRQLRAGDGPPFR